MPILMKHLNRLIRNKFRPENLSQFLLNVVYLSWIFQRYTNIMFFLRPQSVSISIE